MGALSPWRVLAIVAGVAAPAACIFIWTPPFVSFGLATAAAIWWCMWLEAHPAA